MLVEKQLWWAQKWGVVQPLWISKVSHTVLARLMESRSLRLMAPAYGLYGGRLS